MEQKPQKDPASEPPLDTFDGTLERFAFRDAQTGFAVVRLRRDGADGLVSAVGQLAQLAEGQRLRITGRTVEHPRFGTQIEVSGVEAILPTNVAGIRAYLSSSLVKGIGPVIAEKITDRFGEDTLRVIEEEPERLADVPGLGARKIEELTTSVQAQRDVQEVMVFLRAHGLGQALATRIVKHYRKGAAAWIQANPYRLAEDVIGVGFRTADRLAGELGVARDAPERLQAGLFHCLSRAAHQGHCFLPDAQLIDAATDLLGVERAVVEEQVGALESVGRVVSEPVVAPVEGASKSIYPATLHAAELGVATSIRQLQERHRNPLEIDAGAALALYEARNAVQLPAQQRAAVHNALRHPMSVITGGPGVGKTTTVRAIGEIIGNHDRKLLLCAPTGRAAKRLQESTGHPASTIHRLLDFKAGNGHFERTAQNPLEGHVLVVDEVSMLDIQLAYNLLRAVPDSMRVVLVGDVDQLPSVGPGQVLRDIIASGLVPVTRLTEIYRQKDESLIVHNAHALLNGEVPASGGENSDFFVIESRGNVHTRELILELVANRIPNRFGLDPVRDIQILCPMYRGPAGADSINEELQKLLNPGDRQVERGGKSFREGDKVMQIRNDYDLHIYNGDAGRIETVDQAGSMLLVRFASGLVEYPFADLDSLLPAYAITVHRSQGSEYPAVVIPLATDHYMMLRRNLLYTAITRGQRLVVLVGSMKALQMAVRNDGEAHRHSGLADRLRTGTP